MKKRRFLSALLALITATGTLVGSAGAAQSSTSPYKDVKTSRWSWPQIEYVTENGYMQGTGGGKFEPETVVTRAMAVMVLYRFKGSPETTYQPKFKDVKKGDWFASAVIWAESRDVVNGVETGKFAPNDPVTREQLATIFMRYASLEYVKTDSRKDITGYSDYKQVHSYARDAMSWANSVGLITGVTKKTLKPRSGATREQFATIIQRFRVGDGLDFDTAYTEPAGYSTYTEKEYALVEDADIYVAVDGNDANSGKIDKPIATFERAVEMVREMKKTAKDEIVVAFKAGNYGRLNVTLTEEDSGTADVPIRYCAYGDGDVIFQNGITIKEDAFVELDEADRAYFTEKGLAGIKKVPLAGLLVDGDELSKESQLVNNGQRMNQARYPNKPFMDYEEKFLVDPVDRAGGDYPSEWTVRLTDPVMLKRIENYHTFKGTEIIGYLAQPYMCNAQEIASYDPEEKIITFTTASFQGTGNYTNQFSFFSNISEELDYKNEYWVDVDGKTLYVYEPDTDYVLTTRGTYITSSAEYVSFVGFEFCGSSDGFFDINADHVDIKLCDMYVGAGKFAVMAIGTHINISECELSYLAGGGIFLEGPLEDVNSIVSNESVIDNNSIHDFELKYKVYLPAVRLYNTVGVRVSHNEFYNSTHSAIIYAHGAEAHAYMPDKVGGRGIDNIIEYNVFRNIIRNTSDCGAIYSDRSVANYGNIIRYNIFCYVVNGSSAMSIYLGDALSGQSVYGNVFFNGGGESIRADGRDNTIRDNVFIQTEEGHIALFVKAKYRGMYMGDNNPTVDNLWSSPTWGTYYYSSALLPAAGTAEWDLWNKRWPTLMKIKTDLSELPALQDDEDFIFNPSHNVVKDNYSFGTTDHAIDEDVYKYGTVENNPVFSLDENPIFTNPARGDYSIREDADFFKIPFYEIGRY